MDDVYRGRVDALAQTWQVWARLGASLTEAQWTTQTRCPGWDVAAAYAHHSASPRDLDAPMPVSGVEDGEPVTASEILRGFNAPEGIAHTTAEAIADRDVEDAARHSRQDLVERFSEHGPSAVKRLRQVDPRLVIHWPGAIEVVTAAEALRIVLLEATVHLLDVQRALGRDPDVPAAALAETVRLLAELAPAVELIETATGRSARSPFPVLR